ncbi:MAG: isoprenyl transferase [Clostridiales Family XIII bacterium]|jgi:undecaprenyl diphosphate synthase|nr:isoprenyl transferase [Clostridiales Family XIII bacterium]
MDKNRIPVHVAVVMDGNGRWAKENGKTRLSGHDAGMKAMKEIVKRSDQLGVRFLTVYAFSTENWKRSMEEVSGIFRLVIKYIHSELEEIAANNVVVNVIGDYRELPKKSVEALDRALERTKDNTGLFFSIALNYGSRLEILNAAKRLAKSYAENTLPTDIEDFTEEDFSGFLQTVGMPDPDLVIRSGGEQRLSNYLLWQSAYSEFVFTDVYWPDFTPAEYERCIEEYQNRNRRFGGR